MIRFRYFPALFGLLTAGSCKEKLESCPGQCTIVTSRLLTSGQQPLAGVAVTAVWKPLYGYSSRDKARTTTDANGNFQLSFYLKDNELLDGYVYVLYEVDKNRYYNVDNTDALPTLRRDTTYQLPPYLIPRKATVQVTVPNPDQIKDYFAVDFTSAYGHTLVTTQGLGAGPVVTIPKQSTPYTTTVEVAADKKLYMQVARGVNGITTRTLDSLVVPAGTTRNLTLTY